MRDPILGDILTMDEMIDKQVEQISKERGIKDPVESRMEFIAEQSRKTEKEIIDLLARKRDEIIDARIRAKEEAARNFLVSQGWDGVNMEKAKEIADKFICEEHPDGAITFREKTEKEIASEELLPCPFCGGEADYSKIDTSGTVPFGTVQHFVTCKNKCLEGLYARGNTKQEVIKAWNRRPSPWHTGTPTEEGCFYALQCKGKTHPEPYYGVVTDGKFSAISYSGDLMPLPPDLIAWQRIEPHKESTK